MKRLVLALCALGLASAARAETAKQVTLANPMAACKTKFALMVVNAAFEKDEVQGWIVLAKLFKAEKCTAVNAGDKVSIVDDQDDEWVRIRIGDDWETWWTVPALLKGAKISTK